MTKNEELKFKAIRTLIFLASSKMLDCDGCESSAYYEVKNLVEVINAIYNIDDRCKGETEADRLLKDMMTSEEDRR